MRSVGSVGVLLALSMMSPSAGSARTLALWPLCDNKASPSVTALCVNDSRFDLTADHVSLDPSTPGGWNLPPNPDSTRNFGRPVAVRGSSVSTDNGTIKSAHFYSLNGTLAGHLLPVNDFTVEGWIRIDSFDTNVAGWRILVQAGNGSSNHGGFTLSLRNFKDGKGYYLNFFASKALNPSSGDLAYYNFVDGRSVVTDEDIIGSWHHYAIAFSFQGPTAGKSSYSGYFDGRLVFTYEFDQLSPEQFTKLKSIFELGGRSTSAAQRIVGAYSYWRLSDCALSPSEFLNAGGQGTKVDPDEPMASRTALYLQTTTNNKNVYVDTGTRIKTEEASSNCTFETWICPRSLSGGNVVNQYSGTDQAAWTLVKGNDNMLYQRFSMKDPTTQELVIFDSSRPLRVGEWSHVALVMDDNEWRFYLNGQLDGVRKSNGLRLYIGTEAVDGVVIGNQKLFNNPPKPNGSCDAYFSETRIWSRARTADEISAYCLTRIAKPWLEPSLVGYLPLDDGKPGEPADGQIARNCANVDIRSYGKSSNYENYRGGAVKGGSWVQVSDLPVTNSAPECRSVIRLASTQYTYSNSVDSALSEVSRKFTFTGWYLFGISGPEGWKVNNIFSKTAGGLGRFQLTEQNGSFKIWYGGNSQGYTNEECVINASREFALGKWMHIAYVRDGEWVRLYLDGNLVGESGGFTRTFERDATCQFGGFKQPGAIGGFTGQLCEVGLWRTALTSEQIQNAMYARPKGTERKLIGYWPMDEGEGDALKNLKIGLPSAKPIADQGHFEWATCGNVPGMGDSFELPVTGIMIMIR